MIASRGHALGPNGGDVTSGALAAASGGASHVSRSAWSIRSESGRCTRVRGSASSSIARLVLAAAIAGGLWLSASDPLRPAPVSKTGLGAAPWAAVGRARAIDGDTLLVGNGRVRLDGIDAPEAAQTCGRRDGASWACGSAARQALAELVAGQEVSCTGSDHDAYGRLIATCSALGRELNQELVRRGLAWAFARYSQRYVALEAAARARRVGVWAGEAQPPWTWRERRWTGMGPRFSSH